MNQFLELSVPVRLACLGVVGLFVGSFLNWVIFRLSPSHRGVSPWADPGPDAARPTWFDCVPLLGWFMLRRMPAAREGGFWVRAALIELTAAALPAALYYWEVVRLGLLPHELPPGITPTAWMLVTLHVQFAGHAVLGMLLIAATFIDVDDQIIPDAITVPGTVLALLLATLHPWWLLPSDMRFLLNGELTVEFLKLTSPNAWPAWLNDVKEYLPLAIGFGCWWLWCFALLPRHWRTRRGLEMALALFWGRIVRDPYSWVILVLAAAGTVWIWRIGLLGPPNWQGLLSALVGMTVSSLLVWAVRLIGAFVLKQEAMGFGDVTLMAMIGAALGWQAGVVIFFLAPVAALVVGLARLARAGKSEMPYGPFLCLATIAVIFGWQVVWERASPIFGLFFTFGWLGWLGVFGFLVLMAVLLAVVQGAKAMFRRSPQAETPPLEGPSGAAEGPAKSPGVS